MIFFVGSSLQLKHAKLQGAMQMILLSVICVASSVSGFTLEMPELPDLRGRLEIPSFSRLSVSQLLCGQIFLAPREKSLVEISH